MGSTLALAGVKITPWLRDRAVQMAVPGSVLAGPSAARSWLITTSDDRTYLMVGPHGSARIRDVRLLYETPDPRDVGLCDGAAVTHRARTIFDCLRILPESEATTFLDRSLQQGWITLDELASRVCLHAGRRNTRRLRRLLSRTGAGTRSVAERLIVQLLRTGSITGWAVNVEIRDEDGLIGVGDIVFDHLKLVIEVDGWAFHTTPERFQRDRTRQNRLVAGGWTVLRFTWRDLVERPEYVLATIRAMVARLRGGRG